MLNSKQRANLKAIASNLDAVSQIGVGGVTDNLIETLSGALENRELIKVKILQNADVEPKHTFDLLAEKLKAEQVILIGRTLVFYRQSKKKNFKHIEF